LADRNGTIAGSVSGGCIETATASEIAQAIDAGCPRLVKFGVTDERAWEVGLACGGTIRLLIEPGVRAEIMNTVGGPGGVVLVTVLESPTGMGAALLVNDSGLVVGPLPPVGANADSPGGGGALLAELQSEVTQGALDALARATSATASYATAAGGAVVVFFEVYPREPKLVIFGGVHIAAALVPMARMLGYRTIVADGREAFLTRDRFPDADELILGWPEAAFAQAGLDSATSVCVLTHDPKFDDPALLIALRSPAAYVGAIGSRKTQHARRRRLQAAGLSDHELDRLHGPIGLDLGGREPAEIALAILGEITALRHGKRSPRKTEVS
jgi:xanthine dehydrogenase accessory factor